MASKIDAHFARLMLDSVHVPVENEDGGPGSGNWGHKGRPGLVGGSGKGGGGQYRGGRSDIGFYSSRHDWLNGLSGERQSQVSRMLKEAGNGDIKAGERAIMNGHDAQKKADYVKALAEARNWDRNKERLMNNLPEDAAKNLRLLLSAAQGETLEEKLSDNKLHWARREAMLAYLSEAMGGAEDEYNYSHYDNAHMRRLETAGILTEKRKGASQEGVRQAAVEALKRVTAAYKDGDNVEAMLQHMALPAFENLQNAEDTEQIADAFALLSNYGELIKNGNTKAKKNATLLRKINKKLDFSDPMAVLMAQRELFRRLEDKDKQEYLSRAFEVMTGQALKLNPNLNGVGAAKAAKMLRDIATVAPNRSVADTLQASGMFSHSSTPCDLRLCGPGMAKSIATAHAMVLERFPFMYGHMGSIRVGDLKDNVYGQCYMFSGNLELNSDFYSDPEKFKKSYEEDVKSKFHPAGTSYEAVVVHELGHAIDAYLGRKLGLDGNISKVMRKRVSERLGIIEAAVGTMTSRYAKKNEKEFFAENIAELVCSPSPRQAAVIFGEELQKMIEEGSVS